jgi:hypothetical protein
MFDISCRNQKQKMQKVCYVTLHCIVYLQDILKRNTYVYKGRIHLDTSEVIDVPDGKGNEKLNVRIKRCIRIKII